MGNTFFWAFVFLKMSVLYLHIWQFSSRLKIIFLSMLKAILHFFVFVCVLFWFVLFFVFLALLKRNLIQILILLWVTHFNLDIFFLEVFRLSFVSTSGSFQFAYSCFSWTLGNFLWYYFLDNILLYIFCLFFFFPGNSVSSILD